MNNPKQHSQIKFIFLIATGLLFITLIIAVWNPTIPLFNAVPDILLLPACLLILILAYVKLNTLLKASGNEQEESLNRISIITEKVDAYNLLKNSEERYHGMVTEVEDYSILFLNAEGVIENWNKGAEKIKGYTADEIIGKNFSVFYTSEDLKNNVPHQLISTATKYGRAYREGWRVRKDGTQFWASTVLTTLHDTQNNIMGFSKVTRDLTERKIAEDVIKDKVELLRIKNRELEQINEELTQFAYISSHDLQEPLRKIQTFASLILEKNSKEIPENVSGFINKIQNTAVRMQTLIEDLLIYSRANSSETNFEITNLNILLIEVTHELSEQINEKQAIIKSDHLPSLNVIPFQFHQLLTNLLTNALKFSKQNETPVITITSKTIKGNVINELNIEPGRTYYQLTFSDNGIGFNPEYSKRIFEVFQRLHSKREYKGTGIGLAICKKIVENHNGIIIANSVPGNGAEFDIYVPVD